MELNINISVSNEINGMIERYNYQHNSEVDLLEDIISTTICKKLNDVGIDAKYCYRCKEIKHLTHFHSVKHNRCKKRGYEELSTKFYQTSGSVECYYKGKCVICGETSQDVHHITPRSMGGSDTKDNLVPVCRSCHLKAHNGDFFNRRGLNNEMFLKFKEIKNEEKNTPKLDPISKLKQLKVNARNDQEKYKSLKYKKFYAGKCHAFQEAIEILEGVDYSI